MQCRVDFYLLTTDVVDPRLRFICRLVDKLYHINQSVLIYSDDQGMLESLDQLLWTFKDISFLPHDPVNANENVDIAPILLVSRPDKIRACDVLINLSQNLPAFFGQYKRVVEVIDETPVVKSQGRHRYAQYRACQCEMFTHKM